MARPTKLTEDLHERIIQLVRAGMFVVDAAEFLQLAERTVYYWLERGELEENRIEMGEEATESEQPFVEFLQAMRQARAHANISDLNVIGLAAQNDPVWAERRYKLRNPSRFRQEAKVEVEARVSTNRHPLEALGEVDYDEDTIALIGQLAERIAAQREGPGEA